MRQESINRLCSVIDGLDIAIEIYSIPRNKSGEFARNSLEIDRIEIQEDLNEWFDGYGCDGRCYDQTKK